MECYKTDLYQMQYTPLEQSLLRFARKQSLVLKGLLDQIGLPYHRVFSHSSVEIFYLFIQKNNMDLRQHAELLNTAFEVYIEEITELHSKLFYAVDELVLHSIQAESNEQAQRHFLKKIFNKQSALSVSATERFNRVITPVFENVFIKS